MIPIIWKPLIWLLCKSIDWFLHDGGTLIVNGLIFGQFWALIFSNWIAYNKNVHLFGFYECLLTS